MKRAGITLAAFNRRQVRHDRGAAVVLGLLVLLVTLVFAAGPALMRQIAAAEVTDSAARLSPNLRDLRAQGTSPLPTGDLDDSAARLVKGLPADVATGWGRTINSLEQLRTSLPPQLQQVLKPAEFVVNADPVPLNDKAFQTGGRNAIKFAVDPYLAHHLAVTAGRLPRPQAAGQPLEVAIGSQAAADLGWKLGEVRTRTPDDGDMTLVGLLDPGMSADYDKMWGSATVLNVFDDPNRFKIVTVTAFVNPATHSKVAAAGTWTIWFGVDSSAISPANVQAVAADLRRVTAGTFPLPGTTGGTASMTLRTQLPEVLDQANGRVVAASVVQTVTLLGPCSAGLAVLALALQALLRRREQATALLLSRGAAVGQVRRTLVTQGLAIGIPFTAIGMATLWWWFRSLPASSWWWGGLAGMVAAAALPLMVRGQTRVSDRADFGTTGGAVRWLVELAVLGLAGLATYLLLAGRLADPTGSPDVIVAATPVLLTLLVCVVVIRVYPLVLAGIGALVRKRRGSVGFLGSLRALRDPLVGVPLVLAAVTGVAVSMFSVVTLRTVSSGIDDAARVSVGADIQLSGIWMTPENLATISTLDVRNVTTLGSRGAVPVKSGDVSQLAQFYYADSAHYSAVVSGVHGVATFPSNSAVSADPEVPVVVSQALADKLTGPITIAGKPVKVVGTAQFPAGFVPAQYWFMVPQDAVRELDDTVFTPDSALLSVAPGATISQIEQGLARSFPDQSGMVIQTISGKIDRLRSAPTIAGMQTMLTVTTGLGLLLVALAAVVTAVSGTGRRNRLLTVLGAMGIRRRQESWLVAWEQAPAGLAAMLFGGAFGIGLAALIRSVIDMRSFTGGSTQPEFAVRWHDVLMVIGGFAVALAIAIGVSALLARRTSGRANLRAED